MVYLINSTRDIWGPLVKGPQSGLDIIFFFLAINSQCSGFRMDVTSLFEKRMPLFNRNYFHTYLIFSMVLVYSSD